MAPRWCIRDHVGLSPLTLGSVHGQLVTMLDAARADGSAKVVVGCGSSAIELTFERWITAEAGRDASRIGESALRPEDEIVLEILGWGRDEDRDRFVREWHPNTSSDAIAEDVLRAAVHGYQCDSVEVKLLLRSPAESAARTPA
jgi:hypothetical protein